MENDEGRGGRQQIQLSEISDQIRNICLSNYKNLKCKTKYQKCQIRDTISEIGIWNIYYLLCLIFKKMMMMMMMISWQKMVSLEMFEMVCESTPLLGRASFDGCQHIHFTEKKHLTENTFNCRYISLKKKKHLTVMYCIFNPKKLFSDFSSFVYFTFNTRECHI